MRCARKRMRWLTNWQPSSAVLKCPAKWHTGHSAAPISNLSISGQSHASRLRHHHLTNRDDRHPPYCTHYHRHHAPITSTTAMPRTATRSQTQRRPQHKWARRAEKHRRWAGMMQDHNMICPLTPACAIANAAWGENRLFSGQYQAILALDERELGECPNIPITI
jgi:hypothetical protein